MALARAIQGAKRPSQTVIWTREDDTNTPEDLTGATLTGKIRLYQQPTSQAIAGVLTVTNGAGGQFRWDYADADVAIAGDHHVQFTATFGSSPTPAKTFVAEWIVKESL
jgi:hypothetical protein